MTRMSDIQGETKNLLKRAFAAYYRSGEGEMPIQPSQYSDVETLDGKEYVVLRNVNGVIAVYRVMNSGQLKRLKRYPKPLEQE
jgi:hypothetical protein